MHPYVLAYYGVSLSNWVNVQFAACMVQLRWRRSRVHSTLPICTAGLCLCSQHFNRYASIIVLNYIHTVNLCEQCITVFCVYLILGTRKVVVQMY